MDPTDVANMHYFWHRGADFMKDGTAVKLVYRMSTILDVKDSNAPRKTRELWKASAAAAPKVCGWERDGREGDVHDACVFVGEDKQALEGVGSS